MKRPINNPKPGSLVSYTPTLQQLLQLGFSPFPMDLHGRVTLPARPQLLATVLQAQSYQGRKSGPTGQLLLAVATAAGHQVLQAGYDPLHRKPGSWHRSHQSATTRLPRTLGALSLRTHRPLLLSATPAWCIGGKVIPVDELLQGSTDGLRLTLLITGLAAVAITEA